MSIPPDMPPVEWWPSATIEPSADGTWQPTPEQPDPKAPECMLYQIEESDGSLYDVVAWESSRPEIWWLRYGRATFLGEWCIDKANRERKPVWLVPTPAEYLKHVPLACCILRWDADSQNPLTRIQTHRSARSWIERACGPVTAAGILKEIAGRIVRERGPSCRPRPQHRPPGEGLGMF